jgi:DNA-binding MltR family transcriptional regulator
MGSGSPAALLTSAFKSPPPPALIAEPPLGGLRGGMDWMPDAGGCMWNGMGNKQKKKNAPLSLEGDSADQVNELLYKESDRGSILVLGAWLDELLGELLRRQLGHHQATVDKLFDGYTSPLGTFSARINMAHALGCIAEDEWKALDKIRELRNAAAHFEHSKKARGFILGFTDESVTAQVKSISILNDRIISAVVTENPGRVLFLMAGGILVGRLMARIKGAQPFEARTTTNWDDYWADFIAKNSDEEEEEEEKDAAPTQAKETTEPRPDGETPKTGGPPEVF